LTPMRKTFLHFSPPLIGQEEIDEVVATLRSDWISTGPRVQEFESEFANFVGAPAALALNSGTSALHAGLTALGVRPGDVVVTTPMTFCSTVHVIEHVGARPVLVDIEPDTLNMDPIEVEKAIVCAAKTGPRVRAVLPVHLYGQPCDMDRLRAIASEYGLKILEDAAHGLPATYKGRRIGTTPPGSEPTLVAFSFYATKNLTTAEGGMLVGPPDLLEDARVWSLHGMSRNAYKRYSSAGSWHYDVVAPGFKYNMSDIQAAIGLHQLKRLPATHCRRHEIADRYNRAFADFTELQVPAHRAATESAWHIYALRLNLESLTIDRARFIEELKILNIGTSVHFIPIHLHTYYRRKYAFTPVDFPIAFREFHRLVSLPLNPRTTDDDANDVVDAVTTVVRRYRR
jgi:dTDP-4-amino-4,6-dideoxygalactose transaminase